MKRVAVIGGGNGALTMVAELTLRGHQASLWDLPEFQEASYGALRSRGGIAIRGVVEGFVDLTQFRLAATVPEVLEDAGFVMVIVPAFGHERIASELAPHLSEDQVVVLAPSTGGALEFQATLHQLGVSGVAVAEMHSLIYTCRIVEPAFVDLFFVKKHLPIGVQPASATGAVLAGLKQLYPQMAAAKNVLETSLNNINPVMHLPPTLFNLGRIESTGGDFLFYRESVTPTTGRLMDEMDVERCWLGEAAGIQPVTLNGFMSDMYGIEGDGAFELMNKSPAHKSTKAPFGLAHRYITEDVPFGLVPMLELARLLDVAMPVTDHIVRIAGLLSQADYFASGRTLARMGVEGLTASFLQEYLLTGQAADVRVAAPGAIS